MALAQSRPLSFVTLLTLGRVSNLPTVWTNVLAGAVLAGAEWQSWRTGVVLIAMTLFYVGGMYLNDYFDRAVDARERPARPIPAGDISAPMVAAIGFGLLAAGIAMMAVTGLAAGLAGAVLAAVIVGYDMVHKGNPLAAVVMGLCRALVYCGAALALAGALPATVVIASLALLAYVAGLTYAARQESFDRVGNLWPLLVLCAPLALALPAWREGAVAVGVYLGLTACIAYAIYLLAKRPMPGAVSRAVGLLIAGISMVDAAFLAAAGSMVPAVIAVAGFGATLAFQKYIAGT
jgi:4-hydroxybenzoate polyprenyltransferase